MKNKACFDQKGVRYIHPSTTPEKEIKIFGNNRSPTTGCGSVPSSHHNIAKQQPHAYVAHARTYIHVFQHSYQHLDITGSCMAPSPGETKKAATRKEIKGVSLAYPEEGRKEEGKERKRWHN